MKRVLMSPGENRLKFESIVLSVNWSPHQTLIVGLNNGFVQEFDSLQDYAMIREKECHSKGVKAIKSLGPGTMITASYDHKIRVWMAQIPQSWILSQTYEIHSEGVWFLQTLPDIKWVASCGLDGKIAVLDYADIENLKIVYIIQGK